VVVADFQSAVTAKPVEDRLLHAKFRRRVAPLHPLPEEACFATAVGGKQKKENFPVECGGEF
jgi:hypothetical protein